MNATINGNSLMLGELIAARAIANFRGEYRWISSLERGRASKRADYPTALAALQAAAKALHITI